MARTDAKNRTRFWQDPSLPGLNMLWADFTTQEYAPHVHEAYVIAATIEGGAEFKSRGLVDRAEPKRVLAFNPGEPHSGWMGASSRWRYRSFYLSDKAMRVISNGLGMPRPPSFTRNAFADCDLADSLIQLHRLMEDEGQHAPTEARSLIYDSFSKLVQRHSDMAVPFDSELPDALAVRRTIERLHEEHSEAISIDQIAEAEGVTPFHLIRLFTKQTGISPYAYLTQVRLKAACGLMRRGVSFAEVAIAVGFYDQSALNKHFKRAYGITPSQYARAMVVRS